MTSFGMSEIQAKAVLELRLQRLTGMERDKIRDEHADLRLRHAADLVLAQAADAGLTDPARLHKLATWFDAANRTRDLLRTTVRGDLAMVDLLLAWRVGDRTRATKGEPK